MGQAERTPPVAALPGGLGEVAGRARPVTLSGDRRLPVPPPLRRLLADGGIRRGTTVAVGGRAPTSLTLALVAEASRTGSWLAVVGAPALGMVAAAEAGVVLDRCALVPHPGADRWPSVVAALLDAVDVVVAWPPRRLPVAARRRLVARARQREGVLVVVGEWEGADVRLTAGEGRWEGLGDGHGRLVARRLVVLAEGRGRAARLRRSVVWLPAPGGGLAVAEPDAGARAPNMAGDVAIAEAG